MSILCLTVVPKSGSECLLGAADVDFSGPHCSDHSSMGKSKGRHGGTCKYFLCHAAELRQKQVKLAILENVPAGEFGDLVNLAFSSTPRQGCVFVAAGACCSSPAIYVDMCPLAMFRKEQLSSDYEIHEVPATPADVGYAAVSRPRVFWVCAHKEHARFVRPVREVFLRISSLLKQCRSLTVPSLFWETDPAELRRERLDSSGKNCVRSTDSDSWMAQLSDFETDNLNKYRSMWASTNRGPQNLDEHESWQSATTADSALQLR